MLNFYNLNYKKKNRLGLIIVVLLTGLFSLLLCNKTMPTAEGWYSYYADCILRGEVVYKDFSYLFTPVYMYFLTAFISVVGFDVIWLRLLGALMYIVLAVLLYEIIKEIFSIEIAVVTAPLGVFYLQSEVYTVMYDYIRFMDIFAFLSVLFLLKCMKKWDKAEKDTSLIIFWGIFSSIFTLIKQNMGGLFCVYSILLIMFCALYYKWNWRKCLRKIIMYVIGVLIPVVVVCGIIYTNGMWPIFWNSVFVEAIGAKGGIFAILFNWLINGFPQFEKALLWAILLILIIYINQLISQYYPNYDSVKDDKNKLWIIVIFAFSMIIGISCIFFSERLGQFFAWKRQVDVNILFDFTVLVIILIVGVCVYDFFKKTMIHREYLPILGLASSYFTICYGAGMSGGLSIGESAIGIALVISLVLNSIKYKHGNCVKVAIICVVCWVSFISISYKLVNTCWWWGINESSIYECTEESNIPILKNIKLSPTTKEMYEKVVFTVQNNTEDDDKIFCFPHIPLMYLMCDREDYGGYTKVQWFDVASERDLENDIEKIKKEPPKAIVIYDLYDSTYAGHEKLFNANLVSGTRKMRDFLYEFVNTEKYTYQGTYASYNNRISVFTKADNVEISNIFENGSGTQDDPYQISSVTDLVNLSMLVNQKYLLKNIYFKQMCDIDLNNVIWVPIGYIGQADFLGVYDSNNYNVYNINCGDRNSLQIFGGELFAN